MAHKKHRNTASRRGEAASPAAAAPAMPVKPLFALFAVIAIILAGAIVYIPSLGGSFIFDDELILLAKKHIVVSSLYDPIKLFSGDLGALGLGDIRRYFVYRPLHIITYLIDHALWGWDPFGYHLTNIILHIAVALLVYWLIALIFTDGLLAALTALLFVVHPVHTETVSYISGRGDAIAAFYMLLTVILYLTTARRERLLMTVAMAAAYALALIGKEVSLVLPLLILALHRLFPARFPLCRGPLILLFLLGVVFLGLRLSLPGAVLPHAIAVSTVADRLPGVFAALAGYLRVLVVPVGLHMEYGDRLFSPGDPLVWIGILLAGALIIIYREGRKRSLAVVVFALAWFGVLLLPQSNLYPVGAYMAEHWLYLPSVGFFLIVAGLCKYLIDRKRLMLSGVVLLIALMGIYGYLTIRQAAYWKDPVSFYERTLRYSPTPRVYNNLARIYADRGDHRQAIALYEEAIAFGKASADIYTNLSLSYNALGIYDKALDACQRALAQDKDYLPALKSCGDAYAGLGRPQEAITIYRQALAIRNDPATLNNLAEAYRKMGKSNTASALYKEAIAHERPQIESMNNLAALAIKEGHLDEGVALLEKVLAVKPDHVDALNNLGTAYSMMRRYDEAVATFTRCIAIKPDFASAYNNLAVAYYSSGRLDDARSAERRAIDLGYAANPRFLALIGLGEER